MKRLAICVAVATLALCTYAAFGTAEAADNVTAKPMAKVVTVPTCSASTLGLIVVVGGDDNAGANAAGASRMCICKGGGIGLDAGAALDMDAAYAASLIDAAIVYPFKWCSIKMNQAQSVVCDLGSPTVCP